MVYFGSIKKLQRAEAARLAARSRARKFLEAVAVLCSKVEYNVLGLTICDRQAFAHVQWTSFAVTMVLLVIAWLSPGILRLLQVPLIIVFACLTALPLLVIPLSAALERACYRLADSLDAMSARYRAAVRFKETNFAKVHPAPSSLG
mmetsp:Transcript_22908/g.54069  ORF Transcript_22908/g.54069 Transcript_22908/m.54069 type:complete len:147 (-) Transcript_22908:357-797(-)